MLPGPAESPPRRYVYSCKAASQGAGARSLSMVTDKGDAGALPLQYSAVALPGNVAFVAVPVATGAPENPGGRRGGNPRPEWCIKFQEPQKIRMYQAKRPREILYTDRALENLPDNPPRFLGPR